MQKKLPKSLVSEFNVKVYSENNIESSIRYIVKESKFNILVNGKKFTSAMLLPDKIKEFTYGFLFTSDIIQKSSDIVHFRTCEQNNIYIYLEDMYFDVSTKKEWTVTSGCGGGKVLEKTYSTSDKIIFGTKFAFDEIITLFTRLESESELHTHTRCVHKAYFKSVDGFVFTCEDIGRHNTIDKTIGAVLLNNASFDGIILSTGRLTSEMILKCAKAKIPVVVSRTAPSEEGIKIAKKSNMTLIGLTTKKGFTVFTGEERIM